MTTTPTLADMLSILVDSVITDDLSMFGHSDVASAIEGEITDTYSVRVVTHSAYARDAFAEPWHKYPENIASKRAWFKAAQSDLDRAIWNLDTVPMWR